MKNIPDDYFDSWSKSRVNLSNYFADPQGGSLAFIASYDPDALAVNINGSMAEIVPYHDYSGNTTLVFYAANDKRQTASNVVSLEIVPGSEWGNAMAKSGEEPNSAADTALILMWDGEAGAIPGGWASISGVGSTMNGRYLYASNTYVEAGGGATTHTHTYTAANSGSGAAYAVRSAAGSTYASSAHTHEVSVTTTSANNLPPYYNLTLIKYTGAGGYPTTLPAGVIAFFNDTVPSGWTQYAAADNLLIRAAAAPNGASSAGGTHSHPVNYTLNGSVTGAIAPSGTSTSNTLLLSHTHTNSTDTATNETTSVPPYKTLILGKLNADAALPTGLIGMFNSTPEGYWITVSGVGEAMYQKFIMGSDAYGNTKGAPTHNHADMTGMKSTAAAGTATSTKKGTGAANYLHTHTAVSITGFSSGDHTPLYSGVILAYYTSAAPVIDVTINASDCDFGTQSPRAENASATTCFPLTVTIGTNTNVKTNLAVNGTTLAGSGSLTLAVNNVTSSNESTGWKTELNATFSYGSDAAHAAYSNWMQIAIPVGVATTRDIWWFINVPEYQGKSTYNGQLYVRVSAAGS